MKAFLSHRRINVERSRCAGAVPDIVSTFLKQTHSRYPTRISHNWKQLAIISLSAVCILTSVCSSFAQLANETSPEEYSALSLSGNGEKSSQQAVNRYGVPFIEGTLPLQEKGTVKVDLGGNSVKRIFLMGMTYDKPNPWSHPRDSSMKFFVGDELGSICLDYADGSTQTFPLLLGEGIWWGKLFYDNPQPFTTDGRLREALTNSLRLYPAEPVADGNYFAVIAPKPVPIRSITFKAPTLKHGVPEFNGLTIESPKDERIAGAVDFPYSTLTPEFEKFAEEKPLRPLGQEKGAAQLRLEDLKHGLYSSDELYKGQVAVEMPKGYSGSRVSFEGSIFAGILANAFHYNLQDMLAKIDPDGMYHTSTKGALTWGGYRGFGTFKTNVGVYYDTSWSRDMGRSLQELAELGYANEVAPSADYALRMARLWEKDPTLKINDVVIPRHWSRIINRPTTVTCFENDGHSLTATSLYEIWQRIPNRDQWLRTRWLDVKAAGDWILWQFDHPEISGAANGILHTTGESAGGGTVSLYADIVSMHALQALAQMADSIGETNSAEQWRKRAEKMRTAIESQYTVTDPKYGHTWTFDHPAWPERATMLAPLFLVADYQGFAPEDDDPAWRPINESTYRRYIDTHQAFGPLGFYGNAMGYGQGFVTQSALLLDRMQDATQMLDWMAKQIYDPRFGSFIVPEGSQIDPTSGRFWFRIGDLGNGVQEAEIMKALRLVIGVDDTQPNRIQFYPRMPYDWNEMAVEKYPVLFQGSGKMETAFLSYKLERTGKEMGLKIGADRELGTVAMRLGPFDKQPEVSDILVNGLNPSGAFVQRSGDSWWVKFKTSVGATK